MSLKNIREKNNKELLEKIDMEKATRIAKENTKYNDQGYAVISEDDEWREDNEWNRDYDEYDSVFTRPIELDEEATKRFFEIVERQSKQSNESKYDDYDMLIKRLEGKVALNKLFNTINKKEGKEIIPDKRDWSVIELMFRKIIEDGTSKEEIKQRVDNILNDIGSDE
ncbi:hypothetical protein ACOT7R_08690 [Clostridium perfringens]|uniref:hypothetical protein n=1 Tax=Clostridium perfringens TaxID=1502 RepID=UPI003BAD902E